MTRLMNSMEYRQWLKERAAQIKQEKPHFSYRFMAGRLEMNAGFITRILNGQSHLPLNKIEATCKLFGLTGREKDYFGELVRYCRARNPKDMETHFARLQTIRGHKFRQTDLSQSDYFSQWYHMVIRTLLSMIEFKGTNFRNLGACLSPSLNAEETRHSVQLLKEMGLIVQNDQGIYEVPDQYVSTGEKWTDEKITSYQEQIIHMSRHALQNHPKNLRDVSTLTLPFTIHQLPELRDRIREFRQQIIQMSQECDPADAVYQLNIQFFPVAFAKGKRSL